jgi:hypothetical protein
MNEFDMDSIAKDYEDRAKEARKILDDFNRQLSTPDLFVPNSGSGGRGYWRTSWGVVSYYRSGKPFLPESREDLLESFIEDLHALLKKDPS